MVRRYPHALTQSLHSTYSQERPAFGDRNVPKPRIREGLTAPAGFHVQRAGCQL